MKRANTRLSGITMAAHAALMAAALSAVPALAQGKGGKGYDKAFAAAVSEGFQANGIATLDRIQQDETQKFCSDPVASTGKKGKAMQKKIEAANLATIRYPADANYLGDWKEGERIAQSGRGLTWTDKAEAVNGGNCYNCHQIDKKEISHGTIGPSLYHYGKNRGVTDPQSPAAEAMIKYTWGKIYNAKAFNACSNMPRAGHTGILTEQQMKHIMALLLDPASPVNQ